MEPTDSNSEAVVLPDLAAAEVAGVYRSLRKGLESGADEPGASDFYYGEMEMRRLDKSVSRAERFVVSVYWLVAGYGLRATRALGWLTVFILLGAFALLDFGRGSSGMTLREAVLSAIESVRDT